MKVDFTHIEYNEHRGQWLKIRDCIGGKDKILKSDNITTYLPDPGESSIDPLRAQRYREGAVFYNFTGRTVDGLVGAMYMSDPKIELPNELQDMTNDADGSGRSLTIYSKNISRENCSVGRGGILTDYPKTDKKIGEVFTLKDVKDNNLKPNLACYAAENIINWETIKVGGKEVLYYVVLRETVHERSTENIFKKTLVNYYRVLILDEGVYRQRLYKDKDDGKEQYQVGDEVTPVKKDGSKFEYIPFVFFGSQDLSVSVDKPPMIDIANINLAHYRNSADLEEMLFNSGQATAVLIGAEANPLDENSNKKVSIGSRALVKVPLGGDFKFASVQETTVHMSAMKEKKEAAAEIGANIITEKADAEAQETVRTKENTRLVSLSDITKNTSEAIEMALRYACDFVGGDKDKVVFKLDQSFSRMLMTFADAKQIAELWLMGAITQTIMLDKFRESGIVPEETDNDDIIKELGSITRVSMDEEEVEAEDDREAA